MEGLPLPSDGVIGDAAARLERQRHVAEVWDARWRVAYLTRDYLRSCGTTAAAAAPGIGAPVYSAETLALRAGWPGFATTDSWLASIGRQLPAIAHDLPGGLDELREGLAPELVPWLEGMVPRQGASLILEHGQIKFGRRTTPFTSVGTRLLDDHGRFAGTAFVVIPAVSGATLSLLGTADHRALERLLDIVAPARRPAAVLFADLEGSSALARRLPAAQYFSVVRRLMVRMDEAIVERGGLVGKHAGDGMTALFLAEQHASESATACACIEAARAVHAVAGEVADRSAMERGEVVLRLGLHWGATLYVGGLLTRGRADVTALGDEMNEAARIEACATGGRILASKTLLERLDAGDASALGLDTGRLAYTPLGELRTATEKARRDAPAIAVCEIAAI